jgi:trans-2,3-dihydro-3-hydroxyanthranilate isomerase
MSARQLSSVQVDVFTDRALTGNALAVVLDGNGLTTEQMQAIARETNLSETTFVLPDGSSGDKSKGIRVRIFTVQEELPFAGHPTLGTAFVLHKQTGASEIMLNLNVGPVPVRFEKRDGLPFGEMTQKDPEFGPVHDRETVARVTGLSVTDFGDAPIQTVSTGIPFTIAPLRSLKTLQSFRLDVARAAEYLSQSGGKFLYFVSRETVNPKAHLHARMYFYNGEDPATGSAAGCCAAWMVANGVAPSNEQVMIEQGLEMHRPSSIFVRATKRDNQVVNVRVGGNCVEVFRAELSLAL